MFPVGFQCYLFRLDVGDSGSFVKCIAETDDRCGSRCRALEDRLCRAFAICGKERADQAIGFAGACRCPTERTEQIVVDDRPVEVAFLKIRE